MRHVAGVGSKLAGVEPFESCSVKLLRTLISCGL